MSRVLRLATVVLIALMGLMGSLTATMAAPAAQDDASFSAAQDGTGTVNASAYLCDGQTGVVWNGTVGDNCYAGNAGFVFYLIGDGTDEHWSLSVSGSNSISLPAGTYEVYENVYWTASTVTVTAGATSSISVLLPGAAVEPPPPPAPAMGTVSVSDYICAGQTGVIWNGTVGDNCEAGAATFYFYLIGDGTDEYWTLSVNGTNSRSLPVGTYEVYEGNTWTASTVTISEGTTTSINVLHPGAPLPPEDGTVTVNKYDCAGLTSVVWGGTPDDNCDAGAATFYFYLIGDGTDEYWTLPVNGSASIDLTPGTYEVYEGNTWSMGTVTVTENQATNLNVLNPGGPLTGTASVSKYICDGLDSVVWGGTPDDNCVAGTGTFYFYLIGDGTDEFWTLSVNGTGTAELPAGTYEVYEGGTWSMGEVTVVADDITSVNVLNPGNPLTGNVTVNKYICDDLDGVVWGDDDDDDLDDCDSGSATFYFYLIGDGTDEFWTLPVNGTGSIELPTGTYEVWENGTWTMDMVEVDEGETTTVNVYNPD